jgi:hypothetical protein
MIAELTAALTAELGEDVAFYASRPATINAPAVIVCPGDPFLAPDSQGVIEEKWEVLVAVATAEPRRGLDLTRDLSLRVRRVVSSLGARWVETSGPRSIPGNTSTVVSINIVEFKYPPPTEES